MRTCPTNGILLKTAILARADYQAREPDVPALREAVAGLRTDVRPMREVPHSFGAGAVLGDDVVGSDSAARDGRDAANGFQGEPDVPDGLAAVGDVGCLRALASRTFRSIVARQSAKLRSRAPRHTFGPRPLRAFQALFPFPT